MTTPETRLRVFVAEYGDTLMPGVARAVRALVHETLEDAAKVICPLCREGVAHHTNGLEGIGDAERAVRYDLHAVDDTGGVGLRECVAYPIWVLRGA